MDGEGRKEREREREREREGGREGRRENVITDPVLRNLTSIQTTTEGHTQHVTSFHQQEITTTCIYTAYNNNNGHHYYHASFEIKVTLDLGWPAIHETFQTGCKVIEEPVTQSEF